MSERPLSDEARIAVGESSKVLCSAQAWAEINSVLYFRTVQRWFTRPRVSGSVRLR